MAPALRESSRQKGGLALSSRPLRRVGSRFAGIAPTTSSWSGSRPHSGGAAAGSARWTWGRLLTASSATWGAWGRGSRRVRLRRSHRSWSAPRRASPAFLGPAPEDEGHTWVDPALVVEVRYKERTDDDLLRQPVFLRVRDDKQVAERVNGPGRARAGWAPRRCPSRRRPSSRSAPRRGGVHQSREGLLARRALHEGRPDRVLPARSARGCSAISTTGPW